MPRSLKTPPAKPKLISSAKPAGSFWERLLGTAKGPVVNPQGTRGHMSKPKAKHTSAAARKLSKFKNQEQEVE